MKIVYDVAMMAQLVAACRSSNEEAHKAFALVRKIPSHNDWTCKEKDRIDDLMRECYQQIARLCENEDRFLVELSRTEQELTSAEQNISHLFSGVESLLSQILAIPVNTVTVIGQGILNAIGWGQQSGNIGSGIQGIPVSLRETDIDESRRQQIIQQYNPQFDDSGYLIWPENAGAPPAELVKALGGESMRYKNPGSPILVYWPGENGKVICQEFPSNNKLLWALDLSDEIHTISFKDINI